MNNVTAQIPAGVSAWLDKLFWLLIVLVILWVVLEVIGYFRRRAYNLSPMETTADKKVQPDFLKVDHAARQAQIERGERFGSTPEAAPPAPSKVLSLSRLAATFVALVSFVATVAFAFMRIELVNQTWQRFSAWERVHAIAVAYPVGFGFAVLTIVAALVRLILTVRRAH